MKKKNFLFYLVALSVVFFSACDETIEVTGVTLDQTALTMGVEETATLVATIQPAGAEGTVTWASSNTAVATVDNGVVTSIIEGTTNITATVGTFVATCEVTVSQSVNFRKSLEGSNYYPIILDGISAAAIESKIVADFRPNEENTFLYVWDGTYTEGASTGPNFFGEVETWVSLVVGTSGWSGAGFFTSNATALNQLQTVTANADDYYLHIGIKSKDNATHVFGLDGQSNVRFAIGSTTFIDGNNQYVPIADFTRDGEWQEIEIPMSTLKTMGLLYSTDMGDKNVMYVLSGPVTGVTLDLDAVFIYKK